MSLGGKYVFATVMCLVLPMCILISCSYVLCVLMALAMFMFVKVMPSLISVIFYVTRPHSHVACPSKYPHFCLCSLLHVNPVRSRFRHLHVVHGLSYPLVY